MMSILSLYYRSRYWLGHNTHLWLGWIIIPSVLFLSLILPLTIPARRLLLLPGLLAGFCFILVIIRWPALGIVALIAAGLVPFQGPSGLTASMALLALLLGLWLLDMMVKERKIQLISSPTIRPLLAFIVVAILAFGLGQLPWYTFATQAPLGAQFGGLAIFVFSVGAFLLVAHRIHDLRWLQAMTWLFLALAAVYIIGRIIPGTRKLTNSIFTRGTTDSLFWIWLVALAFSQAVFNRNLHRAWRLALGGLVVAAFYTAYVHTFGWKSGWMPPLAGLIGILAFRFWKSVPIWVLLGIVPASQLISTAIASDEYSYSTRVEAWTIVLEITKVNPILGLGPSNYRWYAPLFPIRGWAVQFNSHSQYVDLIAQTGLLGLACFLWFFGTVGWLCWQLRDRVPAGFSQAYVYGAFGGLVGTLVAAGLGDWVLPFFYNVGFKGFPSSMLAWLFLGGLVVLEDKYRVH